MGASRRDAGNIQRARILPVKIIVGNELDDIILELGPILGRHDGPEDKIRVRQRTECAALAPNIAARARVQVSGLLRSFLAR